MLETITEIENEFKEPLTIQEKGVYINKTGRYLHCLIKHHSIALYVKVINQLNVVAFGVTDFKYERLKQRCFTNHIFIAVRDDFAFSRNKFILNNHTSILDVYDLDYPNPLNVGIKVIVIELPKENFILHNFFNSDYSAIYNNMDLRKYIPETLFIEGEEYYNPIFGTIIKSDKQKTLFVRVLNDRFNTSLNPNEINAYDFNVIPKQEIFNYNDYYYKNVFSECVSRP